MRVEKFHQEVSARKMEMQPELSLGPTWPALGFASEKSTKSSSSESDGSSRKKRMHYTWEEPDDGHGVSVRWITTTPWTGWSDVRNYDNPEVVADFREWLARLSETPNKRGDRAPRN